MPIPLSTLKDVGAGAVLLGLGAWTAYGQWKDKRIRKRYGLAPNPERCGDHEDRLLAIEAKMEELPTKEDFKLLSSKVSGIRKLVLTKTKKSK
jgi:hypothetical protein